MKSFLCLVGVSLLWLEVHAGRTNLVENTFVAGAEGWEMVDLPDGSRYTDAAPVGAVVWASSTSPLGAHISISDASTGTIFFSAPSNVVSQLGKVYGSFLQFELSTTHRTWTESDFVVIRGNYEGRARAAIGVLPRLPAEDWTPYALRLIATQFRWDSKGGAFIAPKDLRAFLRTATGLWLPAEFGSGAVETTRLRNVRIDAEELLSVECVPALTVDGFPGQQYRIEFLEVLGGSTWQPLTNITIATPPLFFIDSSSIGGLRRFYRAVELP